MNVEVSMLEPGVFGVSHGHGISGTIIRDATGSWAGHAFLYLGNDQIVEGYPEEARVSSASKYPDAIWAWQMWHKMVSVNGWSEIQVDNAKQKVIARGHALIGCRYDWPAYIGFTAEVLALRNEKQLQPVLKHDQYRTCSGLVHDAETYGGVIMAYTQEDGPGIVGKPGTLVTMPPNLVAPGMLLGLAQRLEWI